MAFLRFIGTTRHPHSGVEIGLFQIAHAIKKNLATSHVDRQAIEQQLDWLFQHLQVPSRFNRSRSKGYYRRTTKGISWFKDTATECLARMHTLKRIAEEHGCPVNIIRGDRVGYIVYEDEFQVVAEPFTETRTS